jgi:hypothetical protein
MSILTKITFHSTVAAVIINGSYDVQSNFYPIPELKRLDANLELIFLSGNGVWFMSPTSDPWYNASIPAGGGGNVRNGASTGSRVPHMTAEAASTMACVHQYQFCHGGTTPEERGSKCGPLASVDDAITGAAPLFGLDAGYETLLKSGLNDTFSDKASGFLWFVTAWLATFKTPGELINTIGASMLESQHTFRSGIQGTVPVNQWQHDMAYMWNTSLASTQAGLVTAAKGTNRGDLLQYIAGPMNSYQRRLCTNQVSNISALVRCLFFLFILFSLIFGYPSPLTPQTACVYALINLYIYDR